MKASIQRRVLSSSLLILCAFLGLAAFALDTANRHRSQVALESRLQAHIFTLLAAAREDAAGRMRMPEVLTVPDFNRPDSGLFAQVVGEDGTYAWRSASLLGRTPYPIEQRQPGEVKVQQGPGLYRMEQGVSWEDLQGTALHYTLSAAVDAAPYLARAPPPSHSHRLLRKAACSAR